MISKIIIAAGLITVVQGTLFLCGPNEIWSLFPKCSDKCSDLGKPCLPRTLTSFRCVCRPGFKRSDITNKCIRKEDCCKNGEIYSEDRTDRTCKDVISRTLFPPIKEGKCVCVVGKVRINGDCVDESECYPKCSGPFEIYKKEGCDQKCNLDGSGPTESGSMGPGCYCQAGKKRNERDNKCVDPSNCECIGDNECFTASGGCEKKCNETKCLATTRKCLCSPGYYRKYENGKKGKCVKSADCKKPCMTCGTKDEVVEE
ncbi:delta-like protein C [Episyrphus balteatus]|uniref:delta-like protein C n=1 Tax=Episyrphus balteatus TaxID=286459 RepID=UPI00248610A0|nr:delta-like protein C [Episyrphus balteatus]